MISEQSKNMMWLH